MTLQIESIDHIVLTVSDIEKSCEFYSKVLGMEVVTFSGNRKALRFGNQKINLPKSSSEYARFFRSFKGGSNVKC